MNKTRELQLSNNRPWYTKLFRWETLLAIILVLVCLGLKIMEPDMVSFGMLIDNSMSFIDKGVIVLSMMLILVLGENRHLGRFYGVSERGLHGGTL